jgi:aminopeptidase N
MRIYFERHDGQAVTCEDFVAAMEAGSGRDLKKFRLWYSQAGTPKLSVRGAYDPERRTYTLTARQSVPDTPGQSRKQPMPIPLAMGLLDPTGAPLPLRLEGERAAAGTSRVLEVDEQVQSFTFVDVPAAPVPSLLRGFSAPVILEAGQTDEELRFLMANDPDPFVRWEAGHSYATQLMLALIAARSSKGQWDGRASTPDPGLADAFRATLAAPTLERAFVAQALVLPAESFVGEQMAVIDVDGIHAVRELLRKSLGQQLQKLWRETYARYQGEPYSIEAEAIGRRALKNLALAYLAASGSEEGASLCAAQFEGADNMTDRIAALTLLAESDLAERESALASFYERWRGDALVVDKWFALQAQAQRADAIDQVTRLLGHEAFTLKNPNRARSLIAAFAQGNPTGFHRADGAGYAFVAEQVLALDRLNPQVAARMLTPFGRWRRYDPGRQDLMRAQLERILATDGLSRDSFEIASKSLK